MKPDQRIIDAVRKYNAKLRKKGKTEDKIIIGSIERFHPSQKELTEARHGLFSLHDKREMTRQELKLIDREQRYNIEIVGRKLYDRKTNKCVGARLYIARAEDLQRVARESERPRDGYNEKIKRCLINARDTRLNKRIRDLIKEIET